MFDPQRSLKLIQGALFDAQATWSSYLPEAGDWKKTAILITAPVIVVALLVAYVLGQLTTGGLIPGMQPTLVSTLLGIVTGFIGIVVVAYIFSFFAGIFGGKQDFATSFAAMSLVSVPAYAGQALSNLPFIGLLLLVGLGIYSLVLLWRIIPSYHQVPAGKRVAHFVVSLIAAIVVNAVISTLLVGQQLSQMPEFAVP